MTDRLLFAIECPWVDVIAHPTGPEDPAPRAQPRATWTASSTRPWRTAWRSRSTASRIVSISTTCWRGGRASRGVRLIIDSDAHSPAALGNLRWGVAVARRAWLEPQDVLNTQPIGAFRASLRRHRR